MYAPLSLTFATVIYKTNSSSVFEIKEYLINILYRVESIESIALYLFRRFYTNACI